MTSWIIPFGRMTLKSEGRQTTKEGLFFQREPESSMKMLLKQAPNSKALWDQVQRQEDHKFQCSQPGSERQI